MGNCASVNSGNGIKSQATYNVTLELTNQSLVHKYAFFENPSLLNRLQKQQPGYKQLIANYMTLLMIDKDDTKELKHIITEKVYRIKSDEKDRTHLDVKVLIVLWEAYLHEFLPQLMETRRLNLPYQITDIIELILGEMLQVLYVLIIQVFIRDLNGASNILIKSLKVGRPELLGEGLLLRKKIHFKRCQVLVDILKLDG